MRCIEFKEFDMIAGSYQELMFTILSEETNLPQDMSSSTAFWTLSDFTRRDVPAIKKQAILNFDTGDPFPYKFRVEIESDESFGLFGKYIQQLEVIDNIGDSKRYGQGFVFIRRNTDPTAI